MSNNIYSMTGFGSVSADTEIGTLQIELRAVNSRFLDFYYNAATDGLRSLEPKVRKLIGDSADIKRGKVECKIYISNRTCPLQNISSVNMEAIKNLHDLSKKIKKVVKVKDMTIGEILKVPGIFNDQTDVNAKVETAVLAGLQECINRFNTSRNEEGNKLAEIMLRQCDEIEKLVKELQPKVPEIINALKAKLQARLAEALTDELSNKSSLTAEEVNDRIRMEVTLFATKIDVAEEMDRLLTHIFKIRAAVKEGGSLGRKLDFIIQELNREANTLASKASAIEMTDTAVKLKVVIEQMREQVQNLQ